MNPRRYLHTAWLLALTAMAAACDHGFAPPDEPPSGVLVVNVIYADHPEAWPTNDSLHNLLFVGMRFVPRDTADFLQLNRMVVSDRLAYRVPRQTIVLEQVETGPILYAGVAQKFGPGPFEWRPVGLVTDNNGIFVVASDETTRVSVVADFNNPPPFPPPTQ